MEIAPGLHRVGDDRVAAYLVIGDAGATLIDAGLRGYRRDLDRTLASIGLTPHDIRGVVLTHGDPDHIGFAESLRRATGVPIFVHAADAARARGLERAPKRDRTPDAPTPAWRLGPVLAFAATAIRRQGWRVERPAEVEPIDVAVTLPLPGAPRIVPMPGHSPGSIAVVLPEHDAVAVGDALTTRHVLTGVVGPQAAPFTDEPDQAFASLGALRSIDARFVLPGHGPVWRDGLGSLLDAMSVPPTAR